MNSNKKYEKTLALLKPDGVKKGLAFECERRFRQEGLTVTHKKIFRMSKLLAEEFRKEIKENHPIIYDSLIDYMTEGPCIAMLVEGEKAIEKVRKLCGPTNPKDAPVGTIRGDFGDKEKDMKELYRQGLIVKNIIHSPKNEEEALRDIGLILGISLEVEQ